MLVYDKTILKRTAEGGQMNVAEQEIELSELERLEFDRRNDLAFAVVPAAARIFSERTELEERIKSESKAANSYWYWVIGGGGLVLQAFLSDNLFEWTWGIGSAIALAAIGFWYLKRYELWQLGARHDRCNERLYELEVIWIGATGHSTFWSINDIVDLDRDGNKFCDWRAEQESMILERACGYERGRKIGEDRAKRMANFKTALSDFHANPDSVP